MGSERGLKIMKRIYQNDGHVPRNLFELSVVGGTSDFSSFFTPSTTQVGQTIASKEWYTFLQQNGLLARHIKNNYWRKPLNDTLMGDYYPPFTITDFALIVGEIANKSCSVYWKNMYKYDKLWEALTVEFNPLWNVDGVETTVRLLQKEGTEKNEHKGKDTLKKRGEEKNEKSGDDTLTKDGSEIVEDRGSDKVKHDGYTNTIDSGKEINTKTGSRDNTRTGGETTIKGEATTDSQSFLNVEREVKQYSDNNLLDYVKDSETFNQYADTTEFQSREKRNNINTTDTTQYGKTETKRFDEYEEKQNYDSSNTLSFTNREDEQNYDSYSELSFDDRKDRETTTYERHGNIGVTTTTQLLTEYVEYAKLVDFVDIVARDILETITMGVY